MTTLVFLYVLFFGIALLGSALVWLYDALVEAGAWPSLEALWEEVSKRYPWGG